MNYFKFIFFFLASFGAFSQITFDVDELKDDPKEHKVDRNKTQSTSNRILLNEMAIKGLKQRLIEMQKKIKSLEAQIEEKK